MIKVLHKLQRSSNNLKTAPGNQEDRGRKKMKVINLTAARNSRRAAAENKTIEDNTAKKISSCMDNVIDAISSGDHIGVIKGLTEVNRISKQADTPVPAYCNPANKFEGLKYDRNRTTTECAACIREDIKAAQKRGILPKIKISTTCQYFAGGSSISVNIKSLPEGQALYTPEYIIATKNLSQPVPYDFYPRPAVYAAPVQKWLDALQEIVNSYNMDNSDSMSDYFHVNFYDHVQIHWEIESEVRKSLPPIVEPAAAAVEEIHEEPAGAAIEVAQEEPAAVAALDLDYLLEEQHNLLACFA